MPQLRNPSANVLLGEMGLSIARFHKAEAQKLLTKHGLKRPSTFYWRGARGTLRKASDVASIPDRPLSVPPATIAFIDASGGSIAADVAVAAAQLFRRKAPATPASTGRFAGSLVFELNGRVRPLLSIVRLAAANPLSAKERITIYPATEYASSLESVYSRKAARGIMSAIARQLLAEFGTRASIKFAYASGRDLGLPFAYAVPLLIIGGPGAFASTIRNPGKNYRKRKRKSRSK